MLKGRLAVFLKRQLSLRNLALNRLSAQRVIAAKQSASCRILREKSHR